MENIKKEKNIAEECHRLAIEDLGKKILLRERKGTLKITNGSNILYMVYNVDHNKKPKAIIGFTSNLKKRVLDRQTIKIVDDIAPFGLRPFFECECGRMARVLYMPEGEKEFKCRTCWGITYESSKINRHTCNGLFFYTNKLIKLIKKREKISHLFYRGKPTKKHRNFIIEYKALTESIDRPIRNKAETMIVNRANDELSYEDELSQFI